MTGHTLQLSRPFGKTLILTLPFLAVLLGFGEIVIRQPLVQAHLDTPSLNGAHRHLERQWSRLEALANSGSSIDCIALGNSMILNGFDPQIFAVNFLDQSGQELHCFNFGVDALTPVAAAALAQILVDTYHPQLLIFGTDARDFGIPRDSEETTVFTDMAWIQYRLGHFNLEGWLLEYSYLYRYRYRLADLVQLKLKQRVDSPDNLYGFEPQDTVVDITIPPDPNDSSYHVQYYYRALSNYKVQPDNIAALRQILGQKARTAIVVVEMPVPDTYFNFFDHPEADYQAFIDTLRQATFENQVMLLETTRLHLIPDDGWMDYSHVNRIGASLFSTWLGQELGLAFVNE